MRKLRYVLFLICLLFALTLNVNASTNTKERTEEDLLVPDYIEVTDKNKDIILDTPAVDASEKIYDFADLYTDSEETSLYNAVMNYSGEKGLDLAIVTISDNNKGSAYDYAMDFYDYNAFGLGNDHSGVLFLIDMDNREIYMTTTGKAIDTYTDKIIDSILDDVYSYMSSEEYYRGTKKYIQIITNNEYVEKAAREAFMKRLGISGGVALGVTIIIMVILILSNRMVHKRADASDNLIKDKAKVKLARDNFMGATVSKHKIQTESSGGSSTRSGSSGISHGGGGHKF